MRRWAVACAIGIASAGGGGCWQDATSAQQRASVRQALTPTERAAVAGVARWAVVVVSAPGLAVADGGGVSGRTFALRCRPGADVTCGCAAVVDDRGYLATAAHVVGADPILVISQVGGRVTVRPARVVYRGDESFDFALLHVVPAALPPAFPWAADGRLAVGTTLVAVGTQVVDAAATVAFRLEPFAGRVLKVGREPGPDGPFTGILGTLPGHHGDSGGPQFTVNGELAGITTAGGYGPFGQGWRSYAVRPDLPWLRRAIEADQQLLTATVGPKGNEPPMGHG